jgi:membrane protease YdiL (CAAX protease family)
MREKLRRHRVACYMVATFTVTWAAWLALAVRGRTVTPGFSPLYLLGLLGPLVGAVATTGAIEGWGGVRELLGRMIRVRIGVRWWIIAIAVPLLVAGATYVVLVAYSMFLLAPVELPSARAFVELTGFPVVNAVALAVMLIAINGYGEETGWRGFLLPALQRWWSPLTASLIVGVVWAFWHAPAFLVNANYRAMPAAMLPMFFAGLLCGSVFLTWLYNRGRRSIAVVAVWHGVFNLFTGTVAAKGALAAVESTVVVTIAVGLMARELRAMRRDRGGLPGDHIMARGGASG